MPVGSCRSASTAAFLVILALAARPASADGSPGAAPVAGAAASTASDAKASERVQGVIDSIRSGKYDDAVAKLGVGPETDALAARPDLVHVLCDRAYRYDVATAGTPRKALAIALLALAESALAAAPNDDHAHWAVAEALVLRERAGPLTGAAPWLAAAEHLEKVHAKKPADGLPLAYAVGFLIEGGSLVPDSVVPLGNRADALARAALAGQRDSPTLAVMLATAQFWGAKSYFASMKKASRGQVRAAFDSLETFALKEPRVLEAATLWNDVVAFERRNGFVMSEKFTVEKKTTLQGALEFEMPLSSRWKFATVEATDEQPAYDFVTETSADGTRLRQVLFRRYQFNQRYTFEDRNPVGGDNVRSITQGLQEMVAARVLAPGGATPAPARKPFNGDMDGYVFEASGTALGEAEASKAQQRLRVTGYVMKGHEQASYAVLVYDYGSAPETTPEIEALVASVREPGK